MCSNFDFNKKIMKKILFIAGIIFLAACGNSNQTAEKVENEAEITKNEVEITKHGKAISEEGAVSSSIFLAQFKGKDSLNIKLAANITDVCSKKGCWMKLNMGNGKTIRVTFKDYGFFVPLNATGKLAVVDGIAKIDTTDVATLRHYAEDANATQEEIDAIIEPEINYSFEAVGVIIKNENTI